MKTFRLIPLLSGLLAAALGFLPTSTRGQCNPDTVAPIIDCLADSSVLATGPDGAVLNFTIVAVDNCDQSSTVTCDPQSGTLFPVGTTLVTCTSTDASHNTSSCSFNLTILPVPLPTKIQVRDDLTALRNTATSDLSKFNAAINYLNKSIDPVRWLDDSHPKKGKPGEEVFSNEKSAVSQLVSLRAKYPAVQSLINTLVSVDRAIAEIAIDDAIARSGNVSKINAAMNYLNKGNNDAAANKPTNAIDDYKNAWKNAVGA